MRIETLKEIIVEQTQLLNKAKIGLEREGLQHVMQYFTLPHVVIIAGIRRAGKSTLLSQIINEIGQSGYYFNFEDERLIDFSTEDFNRLYEAFVELSGEKKMFFFDEIQNISGWERFVRRMHDRGFKFFITGSNASLLSTELGTKLTGREVSYTLYPFSFREYLSFYGQVTQYGDLLETTQRALVKKYFLDFLSHGGMPEYVQYHNPESLKEVYNNIIYRDIVTRYGLTDAKSLRELSLYLLSTIGTPFSYNGLKSMLQLGSLNTVKSYIEYLENSFLFFTLNRYEYSVKKQLAAPKKVYCIDTGFVNTIAFRFSENQGRVLENAVFLELKRRGGEIYYYKTADDGEIDFLVRQNNRVSEIIQVAWNMDDEKTKTREIENLFQAMDELELRNALLLTYDTADTIQKDGKRILIQPVYQWLLAHS